MGQLSRVRMDRVRDVSYKYFDWATVLADAGVTGVQDLDDQLLLKCPFHADKRPSFRIRLNEHDCHCFSCGFWGRIIDLMYELSGKSVNKSQFYEQILRRTPAMQHDLGFSSIFIDAYTLDPGFSSRRKFSAKNHIGSSLPLSVFTKRVRDSGDTWENLVFSLTLMQEGVELDTILAKLSPANSFVAKSDSGTDGSVINKISLQDLL